MKKISLFIIMFLTVFMFTACDAENTGKELEYTGFEELDNAIINMETALNMKVVITSSLPDYDYSLTIVEYVTEEYIKMEMDDPILGQEITIYGVIDGDNLELLSEITSSVGNGTGHYFTESIESMSEFKATQSQYDIYKGQSFKYTNGYYVITDVDFDIPGYEDVETIDYIRMEVENNYITSLEMKMFLEGTDVIVRIELSMFDQVVINMPPYTSQAELDDFMERLAGYEIDATITSDGFDISGLNNFFEISSDTISFEITGYSQDTFYNIIDDTFSYGGNQYSYDYFFANVSEGFSKEEFDLFKELFAIYR